MQYLIQDLSKLTIADRLNVIEQAITSQDNNNYLDMLQTLIAAVKR